MFASEKILVLLYDRIPRNSFLSTQLGVTSYSNVFTGKGFYFSPPQNWFPIEHCQISFQFTSQDYPSRDLLPYLGQDEYDIVLHWPLGLWVSDLEQARITLQKALVHRESEIRLSDQTAYIQYRQGSLSNSKARQIACHDLGVDSMPFQCLELVSPARHFNTFKLVDSRLQKSSKDLIKGQAEFQFYCNIPEVLREYFPQIFSSQATDDSFTYEQEHLAMFDVSRHLIHNSLADSDWDVFFFKLNEFLIRSPTIQVAPEILKSKRRHLYIVKLKERLQTYFQMTGTNTALETFSENLISRLEFEIENSTETQLQFGHGDLCFSNILFDRQNHQLKFVDPRGIQNLSDLYQPPEYDLCKISQCILGHYDWIMAQNLELPHKRELHSRLFERFLLLQKFPHHNRTLITLGEASLFLSMLPLHIDQLHLHPQMIQAARNAFQRAFRKQQNAS